MENAGVIASRNFSDLQFNVPAFAYENPIGEVKGVCNYVACFDFAGAVRDDWGASSALRGVVNANIYKFIFRANGRYVTTLGRSYFYPAQFGSSPNPVATCWDHTTNAICAGFNFTWPDVNPYVLYVHPSNPSCIYYTTDYRNLGNFDAYTGAAGCTTVTVQEADLTDKGTTSCSGRQPITRRVFFQAMSVENGTVAGLKLTVTSSVGQTITNWTSVNVTVGTPIDLTPLRMETTGATAQYLITMVKPTTGSPWVRYKMLYTAPGPELCLTIIPTVNQTMQIPVLAETVNYGSNATTNPYNATLYAQPC